MPRNPAAKKNQHNNRHENGLVGPGKRVAKQKSNGQLNGTPKGSVPDEPLPVASVNDSLTTGQPTSSSASACSESRADSTQRPRPLVLKKRDSGSSYDGQEQGPKWETMNGAAVAGQRRPDPVSAKNKSAQDVNAMQIASTILRSCPAGDTVALLIVLLALPSMILTVVQALFASLTLMPGTGVSPISFLSLFDVFQGSAGSPSLGTMGVVDLICFGLWLCLWNWAQSFALDLAQIQIAITLGNGNSGKNGSVNTICFALVLLMHSLRSRGIRRFLISNLIPSNLLSYGRVAEFLQYLPSDSDFGDTPGSPSKWRSLFAIHILSQALMAFVRRRVSSTQTSATSKPSKRMDTEASAGTTTGSETTNPDATGNTFAAAPVDYQPPPTPGFKEGKEKGLTAKKRRRQANQVRSRQPFWAALASTKVHVLREVEHTKGLPAGASNENGGFAFDQREVVWVTHVDPSSIHFEAVYETEGKQDKEPAGETKPFFVRINGARWHSVSIDFLGDTMRGEEDSAQWCGVISGLAPNCTYTCSFFAEDDDEEFTSVQVRTPALSESDIASSLAPAPTRQPNRPSSPTTTLKSSISSAEAKLNEARNRLNRTRNQHKKALSRVEREIENVNSRLKSSSDDNKQRQKLLQAERTIRQAEESTNSIDTALDDLETIPEEEIVDFDASKKAYEDQSQLLADASEVLNKAKSDANNELACVNNELSQIATRKERLTGRQAKLNEQHDRITTANAQGLNEKERKAAEASAREGDQKRREVEILDGINTLRRELNSINVLQQECHQQIDAMDRQALSQYRDAMLKDRGPLTPEGELPGTHSRTNSSRPFGFGTFQPSSFIPSMAAPEQRPSPFFDYARTLPSDGRRPRSDTNRSAGAASNFSADFEDADPIPPMPSTTDFDNNTGLNGRKSSGSSRGQNNGSPAAGVIGGGLRSPVHGSHSPGQLHGTKTW